MGKITFTNKQQAVTPKRLNEMRKKMFLTLYQDLQLFGYQTEAVKSLCRQIREAKRQCQR